VCFVRVRSWEDTASWRFAQQGMDLVDYMGLGIFGDEIEESGTY
jgi:hypothetical protein